MDFLNKRKTIKYGFEGIKKSGVTVYAFNEWCKSNMGKENFELYFIFLGL